MAESSLLDPLPEREAAPPAAPATMVGADGKLYHVPAASVPKALRQGWREAAPEEIDRERRIREGLRYEEEHRVAGGLRRFANEALLNVPQMIAEHEQSPEQTAIDRAVAERYASAHPIETGLETAAGFAAPLALPGVGALGEAAEGAVLGGGAAEAGVRAAEEGAAKAAEASLGRKVAASAAKFAAEGAVYSAPQAAVSMAYGDPEMAAETMLWGVGLSGAMGAAGRLVGEGAARAVGKAADMASGAAETLSKVQGNGLTVTDDIARNLLGITDAQAKKLGPTRLARIVERADQEGLLAASPSARPAMVKAALRDAGEAIGEHHQALEGLLDNPELRPHGPVPTATADKFRAEVLSKFPELSSETHSAQRELAERIGRDIAAGGSEPTFEGLQKIRKTVSSISRDFNSQSASAKIVRLADSVIKGDLEASAQRLYEKGELPDKFADYLMQKERYEAASEIASNANPFKGTGRLPGGLKGIGLGTFVKLGAAVASGHPGVGLAYVGAEHALRAFARNEGGLLGKSVSWLRKVAADPASAPFLGGLMAKEGQAALEAHLDALPSYLSGSAVVGRASAEVVSRIIGPTTGLTKEQQYNRLAERVTRAAVDADATAENVGAIASTFAGTSASLAALVAQKKLDAISWLHSQLPKDPNPPVAFGAQKPWSPTKRQRDEFVQKLGIVSNPMVVWEHYQKGTLTSVDRDTLKATMPRIYDAMVAKILETAFDPKAPRLSHEKRVQLSMFTGAQLDSGLRNLAAIQSTLSQPVAQDQAQQGGGQPRPSGHPKLGHGPSLQTDSQRRTFGGRVK